MDAKAEPVAVAEAVRLVLLALVALGVVTIDQTALDAIMAAVGALASIAVSAWTRRLVTPSDSDTATDEQ